MRMAKIVMEEYGHHLRFRALIDELGLDWREFSADKDHLTTFDTPIDDWADQVVFLALVDRAAAHQFRQFVRSPYAPFRKACQDTLNEEYGHVGFGMDGVKDMLETPEGRAAVEAAVPKWLRVGLASFGSDRSRDQRTLPLLGLQDRDQRRHARGLLPAGPRLRRPRLGHRTGGEPGGLHGRSRRTVPAGARGGRLNDLAAFTVALQDGTAVSCGAGQSVLEACLAAGLPMPYNCRSGECAECRAVLLSGSVDESPGADPAVFTEADRRKGRILTCLCAPTSDIALEIVLRDGASAPRIEHVTATVGRVGRVSASVVQVALDCPRAIAYRAGQYFEWIVPGIAPNRYFSAANPPGGTDLVFRRPALSGRRGRQPCPVRRCRRAIRWTSPGPTAISASRRTITGRRSASPAAPASRR